MENSTLIVVSSFILLLSLALLALFVYLIMSARKDSAAIIARLADSNKKLLQMQHSSDRTFGELQMFVQKKMKNVLVQKKRVSLKGMVVQTDDVIIDMADFICQTEIEETTTEDVNTESVCLTVMEETPTETEDQQPETEATSKIETSLFEDEDTKSEMPETNQILTSAPNSSLDIDKMVTSVPNCNIAEEEKPVLSSDVVIFIDE